MNKFYKTIYSLAYLTRYSNVPRVKNESVAEHSFFVASIVIKLHEKYEFDLGVALAMAVTHDWGEVYIDDITVATKREFPFVAEALREAEEDVYREKFSAEVYSLWRELNAHETTEAMVVKYADILQCVQYSSHEMSLGNKGYMKKVYQSSKSRADDYKRLLRHALRDGQ